MKRTRLPRKETVSARSYELTDEAKEHELAIDLMHGGSPDNGLVYNPGDRQRIGASGSWVMITRALPAIEGGIDREIRVGRVFYVERDANADDAGFLPGGTYKVHLRSPWGDLCLWPYEYATIDTEELTRSWADGELIFHPQRIDTAQFNEIAFYARTRGIKLADAAVMALGTLQASGIGWFEPRPDLADELEGLAANFHRRHWRPRKRRTGKGFAVSLTVNGETVL